MLWALLARAWALDPALTSRTNDRGDPSDGGARYEIAEIDEIIENGRPRRLDIFPEDPPESGPQTLARTLITAGDLMERARAAAALAELPEATVAEAVLGVVAWKKNTPPPFVGSSGEGYLAMLPLSKPDRLRLATELVTWRVSLTLVGGQDLPDRLNAEVRAVFAAEIERYGSPQQTLDWLHLLAAAGAEPAEVLDRLGLRTDHHWSVVLDENKAVESANVREVLPLLAHRSSILRERAEERMEQTPEESLAALSRAWRFSPGRTAPLRGPVGAPDLPRTAANAERWSRRMVKWARRSSRQRDDKALIAVLTILTVPSTSKELTQIARLETSDKLLRVARRDPSLVRSGLMSQGIDALLRQVPFEEGLAPAPEEAAVAAQSWVRGKKRKGGGVMSGEP